MHVRRLQAAKSSVKVRVLLLHVQGVVAAHGSMNVRRAVPKVIAQMAFGSYDEISSFHTVINENDIGLIISMPLFPVPSKRTSATPYPSLCTL